MNRHPAVVARMASTLQIASGGRLILGHRDRRRTRRSTRPTASTSRPRPSASRGSRRPSRSSGRCGPAGRSPATSPFYPLREAVRAARSRTRRRGSSSAARRRPGRGWPAGSATAGPRSTTTSRPNLPLYLEALEAAGRRREDQRVFVGFQGDWLSATSRSPSRPGSRPRARRGSAGSAAGADGAIVLARTTADVDALVEAAGRW